MIAIPHIISGFGTVMPVKEICTEAKNEVFFTVLDSAQCVGQIPVDVKDIGCDAYYSSLHKWLLVLREAGCSTSIKMWWAIFGPRLLVTIGTIKIYHGFRLMQNGTGNAGLMAGYDAAVDFSTRLVMMYGLAV